MRWRRPAQGPRTGVEALVQHSIACTTNAEQTGRPRLRRRWRSSEPSAISRKPWACLDLAARLDCPGRPCIALLGQLSARAGGARPFARALFRRPAPGAARFATLRSLNQAAPIRSILQDLVDEIGETCNIGVLDGLDYVLPAAHRRCDWPLRLHMEIGSRMGA